MVAGHTNAANGSFGSLSASTDSIHWTQRTTGIVDDHRQIIYNDVKKTYFLNSIGCAAASSTDAVNWTLRTIGLSSCATCCGFLSCSGDYYIAGHVVQDKEVLDLKHYLFLLMLFIGLQEHWKY